MFKRFVIITMFVLLTFGGSFPVFAEDPLEGDQFFIDGQVDYHNEEIKKQTDAFTGQKGANFGRVQDPRVAVAKIVQGFLVLLGTIFLVYAVYAGFLILTSAGNEERVEKGKSILRNTTIGIAIILAAYGMTWVVRWMFVASGDDTYKNCYPAEYQEFIDDPLSPQNLEEQYKNC
jgi:hypothetical protein